MISISIIILRIIYIIIRALKILYGIFIRGCKRVRDIFKNPRQKQKQGINQPGYQFKYIISYNKGILVFLIGLKIKFIYNPNRDFFVKFFNNYQKYISYHDGNHHGKIKILKGESMSILFFIKGFIIQTLKIVLQTQSEEHDCTL